MTVEAFAARITDVPYAHKGVWPGELYLFLSACVEAGVTRIVESGVKFGYSTRVLLAAFDGQVVSVDQNFVIPNIGGRSRFIRGDAAKEIPALLKAFTDEVWGVLIDGPKGATALALKDTCLSAPNVRVVGVHDVPMKVGACRHSHDQEFEMSARTLNASVPEPYASKYPRGGPGIGVWERGA